MNSMKCQAVNHNEKKIIAVCMDINCKKQRLCCLKCTNEYHSSHQKYIVDIDDLNQFIEQESNKPIKQQIFSYGQTQIIQGLERLSKLIEDLQKKTREEIQIIQSQQLSFQEYLKKNSTIQQGINKWNEFLEGILQYVEINNSVITPAKIKKDQLTQLEVQYINMIKEFVESLQIIISRMNNHNKLMHLRVNNHRKHATLSIVDNFIIQKNNTQTNAMAFADEGFDPSKQSYKFAFNIQAKYAQIGVGNHEKVQNCSYSINPNSFQQLGNGQYMISSDAYTFHHTDQNINNQLKGESFQVGDKIQIIYDHRSKFLEFRYESVELSEYLFRQVILKMPITDMSKILYPCALLHYPGDQVQLVEY